MLDKKKMPMWLRTTPGRERGLMYSLLQEYEQWCTIEVAAVMLNITNYLCYDLTKKLFECGLLDIGPDGYKLKPEYKKEVDRE